MTAEQVLTLLQEAHAFVTDTHVVGTSGNHLSAYINKDAIYLHTKLTSALAEAIAQRFSEEIIDTVAAPAVGGAILGQWIAHHLQAIQGSDIHAVYADKLEEGGFQFKRGYDRSIRRRRVLVIEDIVNTGGSARSVVDAVRSINGTVVGLGVIASRGIATYEKLGNPPRFEALLNVH